MINDNILILIEMGFINFIRREILGIIEKENIELTTKIKTLDLISEEKDKLLGESYFYTDRANDIFNANKRKTYGFYKNLDEADNVLTKVEKLIEKEKKINSEIEEDKNFIKDQKRIYEKLDSFRNNFKNGLDPIDIGDTDNEDLKLTIFVETLAKEVKTSVSEIMRWFMKYCEVILYPLSIMNSNFLMVLREEVFDDFNGERIIDPMCQCSVLVPYGAYLGVEDGDYEEIALAGGRLVIGPSFDEGNINNKKAVYCYNYSDMISAGVLERYEDRSEGIVRLKKYN